MRYTPDEVAALLANRINQPHYVRAMIRRYVAANASEAAAATIEELQREVITLRLRLAHQQDDIKRLAERVAVRLRQQGQNTASDFIRATLIDELFP